MIIKSSPIAKAGVCTALSTMCATFVLTMIGDRAGFRGSLPFISETSIAPIQHFVNVFGLTFAAVLLAVSMLMVCEARNHTRGAKLQLVCGLIASVGLTGQAIVPLLPCSDDLHKYNNIQSRAHIVFANVLFFPGALFHALAWPRAHHRAIRVHALQVLCSFVLAIFVSAFSLHYWHDQYIHVVDLAAVMQWATVVGLILYFLRISSETKNIKIVLTTWKKKK